MIPHHPYRFGAVAGHAEHPVPHLLKFDPLEGRIEGHQLAHHHLADPVEIALVVEAIVEDVLGIAATDDDAVIRGQHQMEQDVAGVVVGHPTLPLDGGQLLFGERLGDGALGVYRKDPPAEVAKF